MGGGGLGEDFRRHRGDQSVRAGNARPSTTVNLLKESFILKELHADEACMAATIPHSKERLA
jgi:hypothetical protein